MACSSTDPEKDDHDVLKCAGKSNKELYKDNNALCVMLKTISVKRRECDRLVDDGFKDMDEIVAHYTHDVEGFVKYLKNLNKIFASSSNSSQQVYFSPVAIQRLTGVLHYFNHAVNTFHTIPDIMTIDQAFAIDYCHHYCDFAKQRKNKDDPIDIEVPNLAGAANWISFCDTFMTKLTTTYGASGVPLSYILNEMRQDATSSQDNHIEPTGMFDINSNLIFILPSF